MLSIIKSILIGTVAIGAFVLALLGVIFIGITFSIVLSVLCALFVLFMAGEVMRAL